MNEPFSFKTRKDGQGKDETSFGSGAPKKGRKPRPCPAKAVAKLIERNRASRGLGKKHGHASKYTRSKTYRTWAGMKTRCFNSKDSAFHRYGGRGISVCDRWRYSFANFLEDMGDSPGGFSIERIDNNGNYEPMNCRWATQKEQCRNTRRTVFLRVGNEEKPLVQWAEELGIRPGLIRRRIAIGWDEQKAVTTPTRRSLAGEEKA